MFLLSMREQSACEVQRNETSQEVLKAPPKLIDHEQMEASPFVTWRGASVGTTRVTSQLTAIRRFHRARLEGDVFALQEVIQTCRPAQAALVTLLTRRLPQTRRAWSPTHVAYFSMSPGRVPYAQEKQGYFHSALEAQAERRLFHPVFTSPS